VRQVVVIALIVLGVGVSLSGAVGILRMPDVYLRIQASTKAVTLGALPVLLALVVAKGPLTNYGGRALLVALLLLVMSPLASHALARAAYKTGVPMWPGAVVDQVRQRQGEDGGASGASGGGAPGSGGFGASGNGGGADDGKR
jgi:multicomponent Na+:H+ antiporter subunit G